MTKQIEMSGQKYNSLTVIKIDTTIKKRRPYWLCECDCGNFKSVMRDHLVGGHVKSCGCIDKRKEINDLVGQRFGKLTVLKLDNNPNNKYVYWLCQCDCGREKLVIGNNLKKGVTKSCGCLREKDLTGKKFGRLTVIGFDHVGKGYLHWLCDCECGKTKVVIGSSLRNGNTKSCGCYHKEIVSLEKYEAFFNVLYNSYRKSAIERNISFELNKEQFKKLITQNCSYCGELPSDRSIGKDFNGSFKTNGIDRKDNSIGYEADNCVPCCKKCNFMKLKMSVEDFINHAKKIVKHQN